jgi:hypothetical protein
MISIDLLNYDFPEIVKKSPIYEQLLNNCEENIEDIDNKYIVNIDSCYMNLNFNVEKYNNIDDIICILRSYDYWLVNILPDDVYHLINENILLINDNIDLLKNTINDFYFKDILGLIKYNELIKKYNILLELYDSVGKKRKIKHNNHYLGEPISKDSCLSKDDYYFNESIIPNTLYTSALISDCVKSPYNDGFEEYEFFSNYLLSNNLINLINFFDRNNRKIPDNICLMAARAGSYECLKYFHKKGYKLCDEYFEIKTYNSIKLLASSKRFCKKCFYYCFFKGCIIDIDLVCDMCAIDNIEALVMTAKINEYIKQKYKTNVIDFTDEDVLNCFYHSAASFQSIKCMDFLNKMGHKIRLEDLKLSIFSPFENIECVKIIHKNMIEQKFNFNESAQKEIFESIVEADSEKKTFYLDIFKYFYDFGYKYNVKICIDLIYYYDKFKFELFVFVLSHLDDNLKTTEVMEKIVQNGNLSNSITYEQLKIAIEFNFPMSKYVYKLILLHSSNIIFNNALKSYYDISSFDNILNENNSIEQMDIDKNIILQLNKNNIDISIIKNIFIEDDNATIIDGDIDDDIDDDNYDISKIIDDSNCHIDIDKILKKIRK